MMAPADPIVHRGLAEMTAEAGLLRRAAQRLRETAYQASRGPWLVDEHGPVTSVVSRPDGGEHHGVLRIDQCRNHPARHVADGHYAATMHPPVALQVAVVLDLHRLLVENQPVPAAAAGRWVRLRAPEPVVALARAILREAPDVEACRTCQGGRVVPWSQGEVVDLAEVARSGLAPCPDCCCTVCGLPTETPPECGTCTIRADAAARRREDV